MPDRLLKICQASMAKDFGPIQVEYKCVFCAHYTRAYLHILPPKETSVASQLITLQNMSYFDAIDATCEKGSYGCVVRTICAEIHAGPNPEYPDWSREALEKAGVRLL